MEDMFFRNGLPNNFDGRCGSCPFWTANYSENTYQCNETDMDVRQYVLNGHINKNCPFIQNEGS